jgi:hypothetical protein
VKSKEKRQMTIKCRFFEKNLVDFVEKKLPATLSQKMETHLEECTKCALLVEGFSGVWNQLDKKEKIEPSPGFWSSIQEKMSEYEEKSTGREPVFLGFKRWLRPAAAVLGLIFALISGYKLGDLPEDFAPRISQERDSPAAVEENFVSFYFEDFEDFPAGSITELYLTPVAEDSGRKQ